MIGSCMFKYIYQKKKVHLTEKKKNISINIFTLNIRGNN